MPSRRERDRASAPAGPEQRSATAEAERRQITVLFCDLVDSTALATRLDPEDLRAIITGFQRTVAETIGNFDGFVAKYMGDGVLTYFGYPRAQEHDAERAVRAGLALVQAADAAETTLRLRVGIATGLVVAGDLVGSGSAQEQAVVGETPNLAARLQGLAEPNQVLICPTTRRLVGNFFDCRDLGAIALKGFAAPVPVAQVLGDSVVAGRFEALRASSLTPLVGGEEELELVLRRWERAKTGAGQVILISGEPGLGKSHIVVALQDHLRAEPHTRLGYFCSSHHSDTAFYPFTDQLTRAAGIGREDAPSDKLGSLLTRSTASREEIALLADFISLPGSDDRQSTGLGSEHKKERIFQAIVRQIERLAARAPVLMVFEDAHWSDPTSVELLNDIIERLRALSVLLIVTFRPEFHSQWGSEPHIFTLILHRLDAQHTGEFAQRVAGGKALPAAIVDQIVQRTDGVPLFIEELTRTVLESGVLHEQNDHYSLDGRLPSVAIPSSLQTSLLARLDWLAPTREIAQIGAAIGREFSHRLLSLVADCSDAELQIAVDRLVHAGLVSRRGVPPAATYAFKHALVQDAAYGTLLRAPRQTLHARIAAVLERDFADVAQAQPELLAHHHAEAKAPDKAAVYWLAAGRNNSRRSAHVEAARLLERALAARQQLPDDPPFRRLEFEVHLALVPVLMAIGMAGERTREVARRAVALCEEFGAMDRALPALFAEVSYHSSSGDVEAEMRLGSRIIDIGGDIHDDATLLAGHRFVGSCLLWLGNLDAAQQHLETALSIAGRAAYSEPDPEADFDHHAATLLYGHLKLRRGDFLAGWRLHDEAWRLADRADHAFAFTLAFVLLHRLLSEAMTTNLVSLQKTTRIFAEVCEQRDIVQWRHVGELFERWGAMKATDETVAVAELLEIVSRHREGTWQLQTPFFWKLAAEMLIATDEFTLAEELLSEARQLADATHQNWVKPELYRLYAVLAEHGADPGGFTPRLWLEMSLKQAREHGEKFAELRAAHDWGKRHARRGERRAARDLLEAVYEGFIGGSENPDLQQARALLAELT